MNLRGFFSKICNLVPLQKGTDILKATYKKYVKDLISKNIENVVFVKHTQKIKQNNLLQILLSLKL